MISLEERLAHLEKALEDVSDIAARQGTEIAGLRKQVAFLLERERDRDAGGGVILGDEKPPHY